MVQFIEGQLSPRSKFAQSFSQGLAKNFRETMGQFNEREESKLQLLTKQRQTEAFMKKLRGPDGSLNLTPETITQAAMYDPELGKTLVNMYKADQKTAQAAQKFQQEALEKQQENQSLEQSLDWLDDNIKFTGSKVIPFTKSFTAAGANREAVEKREEFDTTGFWMADKVFTHFNKGTVSKEKLKIIQEKLAPNSEQSERVNKARIAALRRLLTLPATASNKQFDEALKGSGGALNSSSNQTNGQSQSQNQGRPPLSSYMR